MSFIRENLSKIGDENAEHMPIGFEVAFPSLIEIGKKIGIDIPDDSPVLREIYARGNLKLTRYIYSQAHLKLTTPDQQEIKIYVYTKLKKLIIVGLTD